MINSQLATLQDKLEEVTQRSAHLDQVIIDTRTIYRQQVGGDGGGGGGGGGGGVDVGVAGLSVLVFSTFVFYLWILDARRILYHCNVENHMNGPMFSSINPFTPESDQCQNSPAASQEIWHHTVWSTWLFIAYSDEKWLYKSRWSFFINPGLALLGFEKPGPGEEVGGKGGRGEGRIGNGLKEKEQQEKSEGGGIS